MAAVACVDSRDERGSIFLLQGGVGQEIFFSGQGGAGRGRDQNSRGGAFSGRGMPGRGGAGRGKQYVNAEVNVLF